MTPFTVYRTSTGVIVSSGQCPDDMVTDQADTAAGESVLAAASDPMTQHVNIADPANPFVQDNAYLPGPVPDPAPEAHLRDLVTALAANGVTITWAQVEAARDARMGL